MSINNLSVEELGQLFPIILSEPKPDWISIYKKEEKEIIAIIGKDNIDRIEHIGSTAVPGLISKPTIDILLEVKNKLKNKFLINSLKSIHYQYIPKPENPPPHMMFAKGYTEQGFKGQAYHIHVRYLGDWDELYFRDYLIIHSEIAKKYGKLKQELAKKYRNNREAYTEAKTEFINRINTLARKKLINGKSKY